jgi:mRNA-degrading endonuclease toxin of MazEF toxin-antitoxin module
VSLIIARSIYEVPDGVIRLPPENDRQKHRVRFVVVMSEQKVCHSDAWPIVSCCPLSSSTRYDTEYDVVIPKGIVTGEDKETTARVHMIQPIEKAHLTNRVNTLPVDLFDAIIANLAAHFGKL